MGGVVEFPGGASSGEDESSAAASGSKGNLEIEDELSVKVLERLNEEEQDKTEAEECLESKDKSGEFFRNTNELLGHDRAKKERSLDVQNTGDAARLTFEDLGLKTEINLGLKKGQFFVPSPIQIKAIPFGKFGYDLIMQSKSGTGKTCAFGTIVLQHIDLAPDFANDIQAIILAPTREIADQNLSALKCIGSEMHGLKAKGFIGGTSVEQSKRRSKECNVVSGTPGRILHMIQDSEMDVSNVKIIVLDEADRLMESSFICDIESILEAVPTERQMIAASATYPAGLKDFVTRFMRNPIDVTTDVSSNLLYVDLFAVDVSKVLGIEKKESGTNLEDVITKKLEAVWEILMNVQYTQAIIFSRSILKAHKIYDWLKDERLDVSLLTGALDQQKRLTALRDTKEGKCRILVASDLATRGIDCEGVDLVINFEVPDDPSTFVHRFGRAGRFGSSGISITLLTFSSERRGLSDLLSGTNLSISILESKQQLQGLGKSRQKLPKLFVRRELLSLKDSENENWKAMLDHVMTAPVRYPSAQMDTFAGFKLTVEFSDIVNKVEEMEANYDAM